MNRRLLAVVGGLTLLILSVVTLSVNARSRLTWPAVLPSTQLSTTSPAMGVNVALEREDGRQRRATLEAIAKSGFSWVRQRFPWEAIEREEGQYVWDPWDDVVEAVAAQGLDLVAVLDGSPEWARAPEDAGNPLAPPESRADFGRFAAAFAERYRGRVQAYQVWDEPNIAPHWGNRAVDAVAYSGLLREAAIQLRATDPDAIVMLAALAPNVEPAGANQSDLSYLDALYSAGAAPWFDAAAGQPYGFQSPPSDPPDPAILNLQRLALLRAVMEEHGDATTPLWAVAYGWHAPLDGAPQVQASPWESVDESTQAHWAVQAANLARRQWPWASHLAWAWWQPPYDRGDSHWGFALVEPDGTARPVLSALHAWMEGEAALGAGLWPPTAAAVQAEGGWRLSDQGADPPHEAAIGNNRLVIPFEGTGLAVLVQRGPYWAYFDVTVDGQPAGDLPKDGQGRSNLILHDPLSQQAWVLVAQDLEDGSHTAELVASGGWEQWPLLRIAVLPARQSHPWPSWLAWLVGMAGVALVAWGLIGPKGRTGNIPGLVPMQGLNKVLDALSGVSPGLRYGLLLLMVLLIALVPGGLRLVALALLGLLLVAFPELSLPLLATLAPLYLVPLPLIGRSFSPPELAAWMGAAALMARWLINALAGTRARHPSPTSLDWAVMALLAVSALSLLVSQNLGVALHEFRSVIVAGTLAYGLARLIPMLAPTERFDPWPLVWGIALGAVIVAGWGIYQAVSGVGLITAEGVWRVRGPFGSPNNLALYLGHVLPFPIAILAFAGQPGRRALAALLAVPISVALVLTFSRGALFLGLPAALVFLGLAAGGRWRWIMLGAAALSLLMLLPLFRTERFAGLFDLQGGTGFLRLQLWRGSLNMALDHPWLGVGLDNFLYAYRTRYVLPTAWQELNLSHPHNILLDFWTRLGLLGVAVGLWMFVAAFRQGWRAYRSLLGDDQALVLGALASLVATLAHGLIDNSIFLVDLMLLFMLTLGLIAYLDSMTSTRKP